MAVRTDEFNLAGSMQILHAVDRSPDNASAKAYKGS